MPHIHLLPPEVLAHIFHLGTASPENDSGQDDLPALVSLVCKRWHTLALDTPTLWNTLILSESEPPPYTKTRTHIARSKHAPLNIYLDFSAQPDTDVVRTVMGVILPELERWRHLVMVIPDFEVMYDAVRTISSSFTRAPYLQVLRLYGPPEFNPSEPEPHALPRPIPLFGLSDPDPTPRLRDVVLCGVPVDWSTFLPSTLERLQLSLHSGSRRPTFAQFARLADHSSALHTLILNASGPSLEGDPDRKIRLDALESLTLDCFDPPYVESLLKRVCTPSLEELALADATGDSSRVFEMLALGQTDPVGRSVANGPMFSSSASLLTGSSSSIDSVSSTCSRTAFPRLTTLKISSVECTPAAFQQLVRGLPNLTTITLDARDADPAVLGTMAELHPVEKPVPPSDTRTPLADSAHSRLCPRLRTITCTGVPGTVIRDFVERRQKARVPIRTVRVCVASDLDLQEPAVRDDERGHGLSAEDRAWLERHVRLEFFDEDADEEMDGAAWWSTWD